MAKVKLYCPKKCKYCKEWYEESLKALKYVNDKKMRARLKHLFRTLWLNNCHDFDIIYYEFAEGLRKH